MKTAVGEQSETFLAARGSTCVAEFFFFVKKLNDTKRSLTNHEQADYVLLQNSSDQT